jgi:FlaG/FlaF family flagellin (archaellin)
VQKWIMGTVVFIAIFGILTAYIIKSRGEGFTPNNAPMQPTKTSMINIASLSPTGIPTPPEKKQVFE